MGKYFHEMTPDEVEEMVKKSFQETEQLPGIPHTDLQLKDYKYFEKLKKDKRFIVENMIYPRTINAIWSPPAHFKSMLALHMALQITNKKPFLGLKTKRFPVLILDNENNDQIIRDRLIQLRVGSNIRRKKFPLWYITNSGALIDSEAGFDKLKEIITENQIKLLIFDTLHRFSDYDENSANDINRIYRDVFKPITDLDCSILYLHHTGKDGKYRGSIDLLGCVDSAYSIKRRGNETIFDIICEKSRWGESEKLYAEIDFSEKYIKIMERDIEGERDSTTNKLVNVRIMIETMFVLHSTKLMRNEIIDNFKMMEGNKEILKSEWSISTVKRALIWMVRHDKLSNETKGEYMRLW